MLPYLRCLLEIFNDALPHKYDLSWRFALCGLLAMANGGDFRVRLVGGYKYCSSQLLSPHSWSTAIMHTAKQRAQHHVLTGT